MKHPKNNPPNSPDKTSNIFAYIIVGLVLSSSGFRSKVLSATKMTNNSDPAQPELAYDIFDDHSTPQNSYKTAIIAEMPAELAHAMYNIDADRLYGELRPGVCATLIEFDWEIEAAIAEIVRQMNTFDAYGESIEQFVSASVQATQPEHCTALIDAMNEAIP